MNLNLNFNIPYSVVFVGIAVTAAVAVLAATDNPIRRRILKHYVR